MAAQATRASLTITMCSWPWSKEHKARRVLLVLLDHKARLDRKAHKATQDHKDLLDHKERVVPQDHRDQLAHKDHKAIQAQLGLQDQQAILDHKATQDRKER